MAQQRDASVDLARGLACVLMVQTHAFDGWVAPALHSDPLFRATRWLGAFPLPGFLLLAGLSVALRVRAATAAGEPALQLRAALVRRALTVLALGYATNVVWALLDGGLAWDRVMHADVLQVIGLSLLVVSLLVVPASGGGVDLRRLGRFAAWLSLVVGALSPFLTRATRDLQGPSRYVVAPFIEVRGLTAMPVFPLAAWCALGVVVGLWLSDAQESSQHRRRTTIAGVLGIGSLLIGDYATDVVSAQLHEPLSRASLALWPNLIEGAGRGLCLLWCAAWLSRWLPAAAQRILARYGAASLWIYVAHVPFCYGRLSTPLRASLSLQSAAPLVLGLIVVSYGVALFRRRVSVAATG